MLQESEFQTDLMTLKKTSGKSELFNLNIQTLLPFQAPLKTSAGRRFHSIIIETINEQLSDSDRFSAIGNYQYLFYLGNSRKLAELKISLIEKEISRKIELFLHERYFPAAELNNESSSSVVEPAEKWKPPVEDLPRKTKPDTIEKRKMADRAMLEMLQLREEKNPFNEPLRLSKILDVLYTPVWNVAKNHLTAFIATPRTDEPDPTQMNYIKERAYLDIALLMHTTAQLNILLAAGNKVVLIVPVSLATLDTYPFRNLYLQHCNELIPEARALIVLKIENIDQNISMRGLDEILRDPANLLRSVILASHLQNKNYSTPARTRVHGFSVSLSQIDMDEKITFKLLDRFTEILQSKNQTSMVENISTTSLLCAAIGAGASYVSGHAVHPPQGAMNKITTFDLLAVYDRHREQY